jgi:competence protein ComEC
MAFPLFGKACAAGLVVGICIVVFAPTLLALGWAICTLLTGSLVWLRDGTWRAAGALLFGTGWAAICAHVALDAQIPPGASAQTYTLQGRVIDLPKHGERSTQFHFRIDKVAAMPGTLRNRDIVLSWYDARDGSPDNGRGRLKAGARWSLQARLRPPRGLRNPGGFDAERQALLQGIAGSGTVVMLDEARQTGPPRGLPAWRERMAMAIATQVPGERARFIQALALGDTRGLTARDWDDLRALGLTHLVAISGFHVGLVATAGAWLGMGVWRLFPGLGRRCPRSVAAAIAALLGAALYAAVAGFALPTVRTALMIGVVAVAHAARRPAGVGQTLALAAFAVLLFDPLSVLAPGFWLSFGGVLWLVWCLPGANVHWLRTFLGAQGVATLALLPLTVALFGQASRAGPLVNLLAIPWWSGVVVPLALLGTGLEAVVDGAGHWPWQLASWCFDISWQLFAHVAAHPWALWWLPQAGRTALVAALLGVFWLLLPRAAGARLPALMLCLPLLWPAQRRPDHGAVEMVVIDVGQGLSVWVRTRRHAVLYDTGPAAEGGFDAGERVVVPTLHALGQPRLDRLVLSHADRDHAGGLAAVRRAMGEPPVWAPPGAPTGDAAPCHAGQRWQWDGVDFEVLHPARSSSYAGNASSCVLRIGTPQGAVLLAGDIGQREEALLVETQRAALPALAVVVPHHGSAGSSSAEWVAAVAPRLALVSAGHGNRFRHPRPEVVARWRAAYAEVLNTADSGALRLWLGPEGLQVREQRLFQRRWWDAAERARSAAILSASKQAADGPEG